MRKFTLLLSLGLPVVLFAVETAHERLSDAAKVFNRIMASPDSGIPQGLLEKARCIVIVPGMSREGKPGRGYAVCRQNPANWGGPAAIRVEGGSSGIQIGAPGTDIVMLAMNDEGMSRLLKGKFTLGGEATVAAGPAGRQASVPTDARISAEILTWSRSKGLLAGIALQGATIQPDIDMNEELYGSRLTSEEILSAGRKAPTGMMGVLSLALNRYAPGDGVSPARLRR